jgi:hypothetical protein
VAVVGTLLALLVFFALFGVFLTQYVPLWMTDNESAFSAQAEAAFAQFKSDADAQYALGAPPTYGTPFPISSGSVPLIAQATEGVLTLVPPTCTPVGGLNFYPNGTPKTPTACIFERVAASTSAGNHPTVNNPFSTPIATEELQEQLPNRYFTPQTFIFEDDALVQTQPSGHQILAIPPPLNITDIGGNISVSSSFLDLRGTPGTITGQGTENVYSGLLSTSTVTSAGRFQSATSSALPFNFTYQLGTRNLCAWYTYLTGLVNASGLSSSHYTLTVSTGLPLTASVCLNPTQQTYVITLNLININYVTVFYAIVQVGLGVGGG